jgi:hypothetical protein
MVVFAAIVGVIGQNSPFGGALDYYRYRSGINADIYGDKI